MPTTEPNTPTSEGESLSSEPEPLVLTPGGLHDQAKRLQQTGPLTRVVVDGAEVWALTHDAALRSALTDRRLVCDRYPWNTSLPEGMPAAPPSGGTPGVHGLSTRGGQKHRQLRGLLTQVLTPRRVNSLRPAVTATTNRLLDSLATRSAPITDLKEVFAYPLFAETLCVLFGARPEDRSRFQRMAHRTLPLAPPDQKHPDRGGADAYLLDLLASKRHEPDDGLVSALLNARYQGIGFSDAEVTQHLWSLVTTGFEATASTLVDAVRLLWSHPDHLDLLRTGRAEWPVTVEELLRLSTSVPALLSRHAGQDLTLHGHTISCGQPVLLAFLAANLDPSRHGPKAEVFAPSRSRPRHLTFGHGPHVCPGAPLVRLQLETALSALLDRFPERVFAGHGTGATSARRRSRNDRSPRPQHR